MTITEVSQKVIEREATASLVFAGVETSNDAIDAMQAVDYLWLRVQRQRRHTHPFLRSAAPLSSSSQYGIRRPQLVRLRYESPFLETLRAVGQDVGPFIVVLALLKHPEWISSWLGDFKAGYYRGMTRAEAESKRLNDIRNGRNPPPVDINEQESEEHVVQHRVEELQASVQDVEADEEAKAELQSDDSAAKALASWISRTRRLRGEPLDKWGGARRWRPPSSEKMTPRSLEDDIDF